MPRGAAHPCCSSTLGASPTPSHFLWFHLMENSSNCQGSEEKFRLLFKSTG